MEVELKHTWRVSQSAWYIRFYCWLWQASKEDITFCKLWWGYVFVLPALLVQFVVLSVMALVFITKLEGQGAVSLAHGARAVLNICLLPARFLIWLLSGPPAIEPITKDDLPERKRTIRRLATTTRQAMPDIKKYVPKPKPKSLVTKTTTERAKPSFMSKGLDHIETGAAWTGMKARELAHSTKNGYGFSASKTLKAIELGFDGLLLLCGLLAMILTPPAKAVRWLLLALIDGITWLWLRVRRLIALTWRPVGKVLIFTIVLFNRHILPVLALGSAIIFVVVALYMLCRLIAGISWDGVGGSLESVPGAVWVFTSGLCLTVADFMASTAAHGASDIWGFLPTLGITLAIGVGIILMGLLMAWGFTELVVSYVAPRFINHIFHPVTHGARTTVVKAKGGTVGFGQIMLIGFKAVKSNTCPRVEIEE